jgi:hypothetical protein
MTHGVRDRATHGRSDSRPFRLTRAAFYAHLWLGVVFTIALTAISVSGILLNHKRALGLMPKIEHTPAAGLNEALSLAQLAEIGLGAARPVGAATDAVADVQTIDRMDVRPRDGFVKIRLRDVASTEATVDLVNGRVLHVGRRGDVFLEKLHSGEAFGDGWVLLSDAAAVALMVTLITGYWLWLAPRLRRDGERATDSATRT